MAVSQYDKTNLSQADQDKIANITQQAQNGTISWADAHSQAESIRNQSGYSGGQYGDEYIDLTGGFGNSDIASGGVGNIWKESFRGSGGGGGVGGGGGSSGSFSSTAYYDALQPTDLSQYLQDMYAQNTAAELAGLQSAYEQNLAQINSSAEKVPQTYQNSRNEAAAQSDLQRQAFNEYAATRGLNTGTSGQAALASASTLQNNLSEISRAESNALSEIELQRNQLSIQYQNAIAQAEAAGNSALAQALYQEYVRQDNAAMQAAQLAQQQANWEAQFNAANDQWQQQFDTTNRQWGLEFGAGQQQYQDALAQQRRDNAYNLAMTMLGAGVMPSTETLTQAGISPSEALAIQLATAAGATGGTTSTGGTGGTSSGSSGGTSSGNAGRGSSSQSSSSNGGLTASQIRELQSYIGVNADGIWGSQSSAAVDGADPAEAWSAYQASESATNYDSALRVLRSNGSDAIPMTAQEFARHKNAGNSNYANIGSYAEYLQAFVFSQLI